MYKGRPWAGGGDPLRGGGGLPVLVGSRSRKGRVVTLCLVNDHPLNGVACGCAWTILRREQVARLGVDGFDFFIAGFSVFLNKCKAVAIPNKRRV